MMFIYFLIDIGNGLVALRKVYQSFSICAAFIILIMSMQSLTVQGHVAGYENTTDIRR